MKTLVIGHSVLDHIQEPAGFRFQPGGIFYTARALGLLKEAGDEFFLCTLVEPEREELFGEAFNSFNMVHSTATERIPRVHLTIMEKRERCERFENLNHKIPLPQGDLNHFDGILINMISGFELDLRELAHLRSRFNGPIYFDIHSLARGVGEGMLREFRKIPDFDQWARHLTIVQGNETEIKMCSTFDSEYPAAESLVRLGAKAVLVTKGGNGARMYTAERGELFSSYETPPKVTVRNKVGCGDVFGAYFFYYYIKTGNPYQSLRKAVLAGSFLTQYDSIEHFSRIATEMIEHND
jgi:sugar/nucleoside kinase (ribokinase family)